MAAGAQATGVALTCAGSFGEVSASSQRRIEARLHSMSTSSEQRSTNHLLSGHAAVSSRTYRTTTKMVVRCEATPQEELKDGTTGRRQALVGFSAMAAAASVWTPLPFFGKNTDLDMTAHAADLTQRIQRSEYLNQLQTKLRSLLDSNPELVPDLMRLAFNDLLSYDKESRTGGGNGSIRFSGELERPENQGLEKAVKALGSVKEDFDADRRGGPIGWADLIQFAGKVAVQRMFLNAAIQKAGGNVSKGQKLYQAFGSSAQWGQFIKAFGRTDSSEADPSGRVPPPDSPPGAWKEKFASLGLKPRQVAVMSAFLGPDQAATEGRLLEDPDLEPWVRKYQKSRETVSETDYEVDLITAFTKLSTLGQKFNYEAYTYKSLVKLRL